MPDYDNWLEKTNPDGSKYYVPKPEEPKPKKKLFGGWSLRGRGNVAEGEVEELPSEQSNETIPETPASETQDTPTDTPIEADTPSDEGDNEYTADGTETVIADGEDVSVAPVEEEPSVDAIEPPAQDTEEPSFYTAEPLAEAEEPESAPVPRETDEQTEELSEDAGFDDMLSDLEALMQGDDVEAGEEDDVSEPSEEPAETEMEDAEPPTQSAEENNDIPSLVDLMSSGELSVDDFLAQFCKKAPSPAPESEPVEETDDLPQAEPPFEDLEQTKAPADERAASDGEENAEAEVPTAPAAPAADTATDDEDVLLDAEESIEAEAVPESISLTAEIAEAQTLPEPSEEPASVEVETETSTLVDRMTSGEISVDDFLAQFCKNAEGETIKDVVEPPVPSAEENTPFTIEIPVGAAEEPQIPEEKESEEGECAPDVPSADENFVETVETVETPELVAEIEPSGEPEQAEEEAEVEVQVEVVDTPDDEPAVGVDIEVVFADETEPAEAEEIEEPVIEDLEVEEPSFAADAPAETEEPEDEPTTEPEEATVEAEPTDKPSFTVQVPHEEPAVPSAPIQTNPAPVVSPERKKEKNGVASFTVLKGVFIGVAVLVIATACGLYIWNFVSDRFLADPDPGIPDYYDPSAGAVGGPRSEKTFKDGRGFKAMMTFLEDWEKCSSEFLKDASTAALDFTEIEARLWEDKFKTFGYGFEALLYHPCFTELVETYRKLYDLEAGLMQEMAEDVPHDERIATFNEANELHNSLYDTILKVFDEAEVNYQIVNGQLSYLHNAY